jgi:hypothetical protein
LSFIHYLENKERGERDRARGRGSQKVKEDKEGVRRRRKGRKERRKEGRKLVVGAALTGHSMSQSCKD